MKMYIDFVLLFDCFTVYTRCTCRTPKFKKKRPHVMQHLKKTKLHLTLEFEIFLFCYCSVELRWQAYGQIVLFSRFHCLKNLFCYFYMEKPFVCALCNIDFFLMKLSPFLLLSVTILDVIEDFYS